MNTHRHTRGLRGLLLAPLLIAGLAACGGSDDDELSCAELDRLTNLWIDSPTMSEEDYMTAIDAGSDEEAEAILRRCPRGWDS